MTTTGGCASVLADYLENVAWNSEVLELAGLIWERIPITGDKTYLKYAGSAQVNEDELVLFGGYDIKGIPQKTLSVINWSIDY